MPPSSTRIPLSSQADWSESTSAVLSPAIPAAENPTGEGPPNILYTIGHHPTLLPPFLSFAATLATRGVLERRDAEILALRASWNCASSFEWGHHKEYALAHGLAPEQVDAISVGPDAASWSPRDRLILRVADELHENQDLADDTWKAVSTDFNHAEIVEMIFIVGNYTMLSMVANATRVPLEERLDPLPNGRGTHS